MEHLSLFDPKKLLFIRQRLEEDDAKHMVRALCSPGFLALRNTNVSVILLLLHAARDVDQKRFMTELFLPWIAVQRSVKPSRDRVADEFIRIGDIAEGSQEELVHLAQIYRLIVADIWDPYVSLPFACYQFLEGAFTDMVAANLGQGERNKAEYIERRLKTIDPELRLLSGYDPVVRNAISHSGSHGVTYEGTLRRVHRVNLGQSVQARQGRDARRDHGEIPRVATDTTGSDGPPPRATRESPGMLVRARSLPRRHTRRARK